MSKIRSLTTACILAACFTCIHGLAQSPPSLPIEVRKLSGQSAHSAFTDLLLFRNKFYCAYRESDKHVFGQEGKIRILVSKDAITWESVAMLQKEKCDLRDPKLSITPDGKIMVLMGGSYYEGKELKARRPQVSFSSPSGAGFSEPQPVVLPAGASNDMDWLWRVTWRQKTGYGAVYQLGDQWKLYLVKTSDGIHYEYVAPLNVPGKPNETTVRFLSNGDMAMMVRREDGDKKGYWSICKFPYKEWNWTSLGFSLGGPDFIPLNDSVFLAGSRAWGREGTYTALLVGDRNGVFKKVAHLPSGGDTGYPGFVLKDGQIYTSYYSSHEGNTAVYLAKVPLTAVQTVIDAPVMASSVRIWGEKDKHCAFTDIARFNNRFYCVFREATDHVPGINGADGKIRVISSSDGSHWESEALISEPDIDLRDPKLSAMPDGKLMITCGGSDYDGNLLREWHTRVMYSSDGRTWSAPMRVKGIPGNNWFFRLTWQGSMGYVAANICKGDPATGSVLIKNRQLIVYRTMDGLNYEQVSNNIAPDTMACEATIRFKADSTMVIFIRNATGIDQKWCTMAFSAPPYHGFANVRLDHGLGGPNALLLDNGKWLVATREWAFERPPGRKGLSVVLLSATEDGIYRRLLELPSGGNDVGYPGLLQYDGKLWISYYSSQGGFTSIYLTSIPMNDIEKG